MLFRSYLRRWLHETPVFAELQQRQSLAAELPLKAVVRRAEMTGVYVQGEGGQPRLRQVRLGRTTGDQVEVLSGLTAGENIMTDPAAASRAPAQ